MFELSCLPFGLSLASLVFIRIVRTIEAHLRSEGVRIIIYLADLLLLYHQKETKMEIFQYARKLLSSLDFLVKLEKCSPAATRCQVFLCIIGP